MANGFDEEWLRAYMKKLHEETGGHFKNIVERTGQFSTGFEKPVGKALDKVHIGPIPMKLSEPKPIIPLDRYKNQWERDYASYLEQLVHLREIIDYRYEDLGFRIADNTFHYPDFFVITKTRFEIHEVKGRKRDAWLIKYKFCREHYPWYRWTCVKKVKGVWEEFQP